MPKELTNRDKEVIIYGVPSACLLIGVMFIVLKVTGVVKWSWWFVLLPLYTPILIFVGIFTYVVYHAFKDTRKEKNENL